MRNVQLLIINSIIYMISATTLQAQEDLFVKRVYENIEGEILNYRLLVPVNYDSDQQYPLILFLHGAGERGDDNEAQLKWGVTRFSEKEIMKKYSAFVIAPQVPEGEFWAHLNWRQTDLETESEPRLPLKLSIEVINKIIDEFPIDTSRVYITGLSMGGFGTWDAIIRYPDKFAAALPVCGGGDISRAADIAHIPIWNFHGALDEVVPADLSRSMIHAIIEAGGTPGYTEYPHVGHDSWIPAYNDDYVLDWLFSQSRE
jgi:predicted peptidase